MSEPRPEPTKSFLQRTWLRRSLLALAIMLALLLAVILTIPPVVSSDWARVKVERALASATGKPASLRLLSFGWSDGLRVEGLYVGRGGLEDAAFFCSLERLHVDIGFLSALRKDFNLRVQLSGLRVRQRVEPGAKEPQPSVQPPARVFQTLLKDTLTAMREGLKPAPRRGDAHILVDLSDIAVRLDLASSNSTLDLRDVSLRLRAPGLAGGPVRLDAGLKAWLNGKELTPLKVEATVDGLADKSGMLTPAQAQFTAKVLAPGLNLTALGSVEKGLKTDLRLDLRQAAALLRPFAGASLPEASGSLALGLTLAQTGPDHLDLGLVVFADALNAVGGPLGAKAVGPLKLNLLQEANFDLAAGTIRLPGNLNLLNKSAVRWQGEVTGLNQGQLRIILSILPLRLQLDELVSVARAWLPPGLGIGPATAVAEGIGLEATLPEQPGQKPRLEANVKGLRVEANNITRANGPERMSLARALLRLDSAQAALPDSGPGQLHAAALLELDGLRMQGKSPLVVKRAALSNISAKIDGFALDPLALFGVTGAASLDMTGEVLGLDLPGKAQIPALSKGMSLRADLPASKTAAARLESLVLDIPLLRVLQRGKRPVESPLTLRLTAPDLRLAGSTPLTASFQDAKLNLEMGQALRCGATASMAGSAVRSSGSLTLDAQKLLALAAPLLPPKARGSGSMALDWKLSADLPQGQAKAPAQEKLSQKLARLGFLKELEAALKLSEVSLDWPLAGTKDRAGETLRLRGLTTPKPLRAATSGGLRESSLSGTLAFGPIAELPGLGPVAKPLRGLLTLTAAQQGLRSAQFSQLLHMDGLEVDQSLRLNLDRLDQVLDRDQDRLAAMLELMDATVGFDLRAGLQSPLAASSKGASGKGLTGKGRIEAGFDARLSGGRSLALSARLLSPGLDLRLGPELAMTGLTSSLRLNKRYSLSPGLRCATPASDVILPLSEQVFDLFPTSARGVGDDSVRTFLHEFQPVGGSLGLRQLTLKSGALPVNMHDVFVRLDTGGALPALRSFRAGLLGGNLLGSAMVKGGRGNYSLAADLAFTGIDPSRLFQAKAAKDLGDQAETAGRVSLSVPLTPDPEVLLQRMALRADITKIGPRTLERMLYALDPDEQNETIVQQRRLMDIGYPRFVRVGMAYGNLNLSGEVEVKGFRLELPRIDRLPVGNLPIRKQLTKALAPVQSLSTILDAVSAGGICRDQGGPLKVIGNTAQEGVAP